MIERATDAIRFNEIVNHPDVLPHVCGPLEGPLDFTPLVQDRNNVVLMGEHGAIMFHCHQRGLYEAHTQVVPEGRGRWALAFAREALRWMFIRTDAMEIITRVAVGNLAALALTRACHFQPVVTMKGGWPVKGGAVDCGVHNLLIQDWIGRERSLRERGEWFLRHWSNPAIRDEQAMGLAYEMLLHGQAQKSAIFLSRWSAITGSRVPVECLSQKPPRLMIGKDCVVVRGDKSFIVF